MGRYHLLFLTALLFGGTSVPAADYTVDFSRVTNLESIRPLVEGCADFDAMEIYRDRMESITNLEEMRSTLSGLGFGMFNQCPDGISGIGIAAIKPPAAAAVPIYTVDFNRVKDFETLRPLIKECGDFGGLEHFRQTLESAANLNELAATLRGLGIGRFDECPPGITGAGIATVE